MKVLVIHMRYQPDPTGTAPLVTQLVEDLVEQGLEITVVTSLPHYGRKSVHPDYRSYRGYFHRTRQKNLEIIRTPIFVPRNRGMLPRAVNYLSYTFNAIAAGLTVGNIDLVLAVNPPITASFSAFFLSLLRRVPTILSIQDVWPDCVVEVGQLKNPLMIGFTRWLEKVQYRAARKIVVLSEGMKNNLILKGVLEDKIEIVSNWADPDQVSPVEGKNSFSEQHQLKDQFTVLFSGNHGYISALDQVVEAANELVERRNILFILAGEGSVKEEVVRLARDKNLDNILFLPTQGKDDWLEMLAASDLGLVTLRKNLGSLNVPSKVYTLMAAGKPILGSVPENSEIVNLVQTAQCGIVCPPENPQALAEAVLAASQSRDKLLKMGKRGRKYLIKNLSRKQQTGMYYRLLTKAAGNKN